MSLFIFSSHRTTMKQQKMLWKGFLNYYISNSTVTFQTYIFFTINNSFSKAKNFRVYFYKNWSLTTFFSESPLNSSLKLNGTGGRVVQPQHTPCIMCHLLQTLPSLPPSPPPVFPVVHCTCRTADCPDNFLRSCMEMEKFNSKYNAKK